MSFTEPSGPARAEAERQGAESQRRNEAAEAQRQRQARQFQNANKPGNVTAGSRPQ